jgi:KDO2-lipid IV(A) lauroyltransferase
MAVETPAATRANLARVAAHAMLTSFGLAALGVLARTLPPRPGYALARAGARLHFRLAPVRRAAIRSNLRGALAFGDGAGAGYQEAERELDTAIRSEPPSRTPTIERLVVEAFESHGCFMFEWLRGAGGARVELTLEGRPHLDAALARGRGAILVTCHLGNWEVAAYELAQAGYPLAVVTGKQLGRLAPAVRQDKERRGIQVVGPGDGLRALYRCLEANRILVLLIDGDGWRRGRTLDFLGRPTLLPCGAVRLARTTGARLMAATMHRTGPLRFAARIHPPLPTAGRERTEELMRTLLRPLERAIADDPAQWCLFRALWQEAASRAAARRAA